MNTFVKACTPGVVWIFKFATYICIMVYARYMHVWYVHVICTRTKILGYTVLILASAGIEQQIITASRAVQGSYIDLMSPKFCFYIQQIYITGFISGGGPGGAFTPSLLGLICTPSPTLLRNWFSLYIHVPFIWGYPLGFIFALP